MRSIHSTPTIGRRNAMHGIEHGSIHPSIVTAPIKGGAEQPFPLLPPRQRGDGLDVDIVTELVGTVLSPLQFLKYLRGNAER